MKRTRTSKPMQWPFWLLVVAWFCASCPPSTRTAPLIWAIGLHHFCHQADLLQKTAEVLGKRSPQKKSGYAVADEARTSKIPEIPSESSSPKKSVLACGDSDDAIGAALISVFVYPETNDVIPISRREDTPQPPPRSAALI